MRTLTLVTLAALAAAPLAAQRRGADQPQSPQIQRPQIQRPHDRGPQDQRSQGQRSQGQGNWSQRNQNQDNQAPRNQDPSHQRLLDDLRRVIREEVRDAVRDEVGRAMREMQRDSGPRGAMPMAPRMRGRALRGMGVGRGFATPRGHVEIEFDGDVEMDEGRLFRILERVRGGEGDERIQMLLRSENAHRDDDAHHDIEEADDAHEHEGHDGDGDGHGRASDAPRRSYRVMLRGGDGQGDRQPRVLRWSGTPPGATDGAAGSGGAFAIVEEVQEEAVAEEADGFIFDVTENEQETKAAPGRRVRMIMQGQDGSESRTLTDAMRQLETRDKLDRIRGELENLELGTQASDSPAIESQAIESQAVESQARQLQKLRRSLESMRSSLEAMRQRVEEQRKAKTPANDVER